MAKDLVSVAIDEVGNGPSKYTSWYGVSSNTAWCQIFVCWCAYKSGVGSRIKKTAGTTQGMDYFKSKNRFENKSDYFPKRNDLIYLKNGYSHVAIVEKATGNGANGIIYTIDGNGGGGAGKVCRSTYKANDPRITGYGLLFSEDEEETYKIDNSLPKPLEVSAKSDKDNEITVTWKNYSNIIECTYRVIIDGVTVSNSVGAGKYIYNSIDAGNHTVAVETIGENNSASKRVTVKVTVKGKKVSNEQSSGVGTGSTSKNTKTKSSTSAKQELKYLKQFLKTIDKKDKENSKKKKQEYEISKVNYNHKVEISVIVQHGKNLFSPPVVEGLKVVWERKNTAGKMTFQTIASSKAKYSIVEGNPVLVSINKQKFFYGFVFEVKQTKSKMLDVIVYDQLRYLKNKDTVVYKKKTSSQLIRMVTKDMGMNVGSLVNTKYPVTRSEDNMTLFDMIFNSLTETLMATGEAYVLYDDCGSLTLKSPKKMKVLGSLIDADTAEDYSYTRSIDQDVYNQIKLEYVNDKNKVKFYYTRSKKSMSKWGTLQYFEKIDSPKIAKLKGKVLLKLYNKVSKTLSITGAFGNTKVRAGSLIPVLLDLSPGVKVSSFMLVDKVTHTFNNCEHKMDLSLSGGGFDSSE